MTGKIGNRKFENVIFENWKYANRKSENRKSKYRKWISDVEHLLLLEQWSTLNGETGNKTKNNIVVHDKISVYGKLPGVFSSLCIFHYWNSMSQN